ncbi:GNAT family N-acetyltransferase [Aliiroseovarius crassostreae]|uniref:GNAT family N-acetyltransferase n=1 Tax=Aliiroseovarius crassostreae TaxID=154981 RepID=UPI0021FF037F|nr:GNAT family N-acetyltransferase [Aliiroseovarius crassostreae]UWP93366.1 GNAT family N-acetyltransferase [Aliiroseovarius crassostreae]
MMTRLVTRRLMMRRTEPADLEALHALVSHHDVVKMTATWPWPAERDHTRARCVPSDPQLGMVGQVFHKGELVGSMGIASRDGQLPEMGYMFAPAYWGRGFATEMGQALIAHCWQRYDWTEISACVFGDNPASGRVLEKLGFVATGPCRGYCRARDEELPTLTYRLSRP